MIGQYQQSIPNTFDKTKSLNKISVVVDLDYQLCMAYCTLQNVAFFCQRLGVDNVRSASLKKCTQRSEGPQAGPHTVQEQNF